KVAIRTPFGKAGLSFHVIVSGITWTSVFCAMAGIESAINPVAANSNFFMRVPPKLYAARDANRDARSGNWSRAARYVACVTRAKLHHQRRTNHKSEMLT